MTKPYVVSGDIDILLKRWVTKHGFSLPTEEFFFGLRNSLVSTLRLIFGTVDFVPSSELVNPVFKNSATEPSVLVTLDKVYVQSTYSLELTRSVLSDLSDGPIGARQGRPDEATQVAQLRQELANQDNIVIYDDVIFSGHLLKSVCKQLQAAKFNIKTVLCGVGIMDGISRINQYGLPVCCTRIYEEVIDQICERDFYPGVDYAGRTLHTDRSVGLPYLLPFGNPCSWASIPKEHAQRFSRFCIKQSILLFQEIERNSGKFVLCSDIDRKLTDWPQNGARFVDYLVSMEKKIPKESSSPLLQPAFSS